MPCYKAMIEKHLKLNAIGFKTRGRWRQITVRRKIWEKRVASTCFSYRNGKLSSAPPARGYKPMPQKLATPLLPDVIAGRSGYAIACRSRTTV